MVLGPSTLNSGNDPLNRDAGTDFIITIPDADQSLFIEHAVHSVTLTESLLSPSVYIAINCHDKTHTDGSIKDLDNLAGTTVNIEIERPINGKFNTAQEISISSQRLYKLSNRQPRNHETENYTMNACHPSLLKNAATRMSKSWNCTPPDRIAEDALANCLKQKNLYIEQSTPERTYFAENIHPFQVVAQQADVALSNNNDPDFLHYMTFEQSGTHRFESLNKMTENPVVAEFVYSESGDIEKYYYDPRNILSFEFPCDFDLLADILNGVDEDGLDQNALTVTNPKTGIISLLGNQDMSCGQGGPRNCNSFTNINDKQNCDIDVEKHKLRRQARLSLLDQGKIALRIIVPWNPDLHAGKMIHVTFWNKDHSGDTMRRTEDYATGEYLISSMTHHLKAGGYGVTALDCVSKTVGAGRTLG
jgi:hypothetical protein